MSQIDKKRIAKNSLALYVRVIITMLITLWTTRVVLNALGVEDYGIYNVVGGFVAMLSVLTSSLSASISRYLTYEIGHGDEHKLRSIFKSSLYILFALSGILLLVAETIGLWFVIEKLKYPVGRTSAVVWVYQLSILSFIISLISVPYNALIVAHERMKVFAYVGICTATAKFGVALAVLLLPSGGRLIGYAALLCLVEILVRIFYGTYSSRNFPNISSGSYTVSKSLFKDIFAFASWNFIGSTASILRSQGLNMLLNIFFGPAVNAARGLAVQASGAATTFANNFLVAMNPQITKSYAAGERRECLELGYTGSRLGYMLMYLFAFPLILVTPEVLKLWLKIVPDYTVIFVRLVLINALIDVLSYTLTTTLLATGKIKWYQIVVGGCNLMVIPVSYLALKMGLAPQSTLQITIFFSLVALGCRLYFIKRLAGGSMRQYVSSVLNRVVGVTVISSLIGYGLIKVLPSATLGDNILIVLIGGGVGMIAIYFLGLRSQERTIINTTCLKICRIRK